MLTKPHFLHPFLQIPTSLLNRRLRAVAFPAIPFWVTSIDHRHNGRPSLRLLSTLMMPGLADIHEKMIDGVADPCDDFVDERVLTAVHTQDGDSVWVSFQQARGLRFD